MKNHIMKDNVEFGGKNHFDRVHNWITRDKNLSDSAYRLFIIYQNASIDSAIESKNFHPTEIIMAKIMGVSKKTIVRYNSELEKLGYLSIERIPFTNDFNYIIHPIPIKTKLVTKMTPETGIKNDTTILQ